MNKKRVSLIILIIWMIIIFIMSSFDANASSNQSGIIVNFISNLFHINDIELLSFIIRKMAHFVEYFILGILLINCLIDYNKKLYLGYVIGILYAISDECHQLFVSGRSGQVRDIIIDVVGLILGIILIRFVKKR